MLKYDQNLISGKAIGLPDAFITTGRGSKGGGAIQVNNFRKD